MKWNAVPYVFLTPLLIIGILINNHVRYPENHLYWMVLFLAIISSIYFYTKVFFKANLRLALTISLSISFMLLGFLTSQLSWQKNKPSTSKATISQATAYTARIDSKPEKTRKTTRYEVKINEIQTNEKCITCN